MRKYTIIATLLMTASLFLAGCQKDDTDFDEVIAEYEAQPDIDILWDDSAFNEEDDVPITDENNEYYNDYVENTDFSRSITINYNGETATVEGTVSGVLVETVGAHVSVTSAKGHVNYILSGNTSNGSFKVYSFNKFCITLNGVSITNSLSIFFSAVLTTSAANRATWCWPTEPPTTWPTDRPIPKWNWKTKKAPCSAKAKSSSAARDH